MVLANAELNTYIAVKARECRMLSALLSSSKICFLCAFIASECKKLLHVSLRVRDKVNKIIFIYLAAALSFKAHHAFSSPLDNYEYASLQNDVRFVYRENKLLIFFFHSNI